MPRASSRSSSSAPRSSRSAASTCSAWASPSSAAQQAERKREHDEPLLGAVVQVALEPLALGVARGDGPGACRSQLLELSARLGLQALAVEREARGGADVLEQLRVVAQFGSVDEERDRPAAARERRHHSAVALG